MNLFHEILRNFRAENTSESNIFLKFLFLLFLALMA